MMLLGGKLQRYLIELLIGLSGDISIPVDGEYRRHHLVGYTDDPEEMRQFAIVIYPSGFFSPEVYGRGSSMPSLPLKEWRGVPLLFGEDREEWIEETQTLVIYADIIASAYFMISRYEEMLRRGERDELGRFPGKLSLPYRAGFIDRPIVDEYSEALRTIITEHGLDKMHGVQLEERPRFFAKINLTHDIVSPFEYRGLSGWYRSIAKGGEGIFEGFDKAFGCIKRDRFFTFPQLLSWNHSLAKSVPEGLVQTIFFWASHTCGKHERDKASYNLKARYMVYLRQLAERAKVKHGLLCSYASSIDPHRIERERKALASVLGAPIINHSRHYLLSLNEPEDSAILYGQGTRHDYTMGYADVAGFRLGTCRPVRAINPNTRSLTDLTLHPLTIMDEHFAQGAMNLSSKEAEAYAQTLVRQVAYYNGELNLLWHNENLSIDVHPWLGRLYRQILELVQSIESKDDRYLDEEDRHYSELHARHGFETIQLEDGWDTFS